MNDENNNDEFFNEFDEVMKVAETLTSDQISEDYNVFFDILEKCDQEDRTLIKEFIIFIKEDNLEKPGYYYKYSELTNQFHAYLRNKYSNMIYRNAVFFKILTQNIQIA